MTEVKKKQSAPPKVAAVHDVSCIGRCASTVILPVLSVCGVQACPLPTALLSTHTGGYQGFTFMDLTEEMPKIINHWKQLGTTFDAVYSGFLGSAGQIRLVRDFAEACKAANPHCLFLADPVMGDDGRTYATYTEEMCCLTRTLVSEADLITPNLTEACILLNIPYRQDFSDTELCTMAKSLCALGAPTAIITGVHREALVGAVYYDALTGEYGEYFTPRDPNNYPGAGDIFASVVLAGRLKNAPLGATVRRACEFIFQASCLTTALGTPVREGLAIEAMLGVLAEQEQA